MQSRVSAPVAAIIIVVACLVVGFVYWHSQAGSAVVKDAKGIPLGPAESRPGMDALHNAFQSGAARPRGFTGGG